jgi:hypothetical protein
MKICALFLGALCALTAQTAIKPEQIRTSPAPLPRLLAFDSAGRLTLLAIGPGVEIVNGALVATGAAPPALVLTRLIRSADGNYPATAGVVARNGVIQERGADYAISGGMLVPASPWAADDVVTAITAERASLPAVTRGAP